jgi:hypothetical protein
MLQTLLKQFHMIIAPGKRPRLRCQFIPKLPDKNQLLFRRKRFQTGDFFRYHTVILLNFTTGHYLYAALISSFAAFVFSPGWLHSTMPRSLFPM